MRNKCPLCQSGEPKDFWQDKKRPYFRCLTCRLVFVPPAFHLADADEKAEYDLHQNNPDDQEYRKFLSRLFLPLNERLDPESHGLDFGSGPGSALPFMFEEAGHEMELFDKFYAPDDSVFEKQFDFISATEVVEHLRNPQKELERLWRCLKAEGWLGIMTKLVLGRDEFKQWHYKNDLTHVCFYSKETFLWVADKWQAEIVFADKDVILLNKTC